MRRWDGRLRILALSVMGLFVTGAIPVRDAVAAKGDAARGRLKVYFIDVEGGQSTLFVTPAGQSLLIDTGWPGHEGRDAERIVAAAKDAGLSRIDYVLLTHYHTDHVGGVPQLVERIPVGTFIDHGPNREMEKATEEGYSAYQKVLATGKSKHLVVKPGEVLPVRGMKATVISADGKLISKALPGAGQQNAYCGASETRPTDQTENSRSTGVEIAFGKLKILDLGDLTWDKEMELMCPVNKLGSVDIDVVSHHGLFQSSSPALVHAIHPRIAVMDNSSSKGGSSPTFQTYKKSPGLETLWQLQFSKEAGDDLNSSEEYIANPKGTDAGHYLEVIADRDGSFDVLNSRTGATKHYAAIH